jgi:hypothetical protein
VKIVPFTLMSKDAVAPGDQIWLNYINLFVRTVKRDGRLAAIGSKYKLGPVLDIDR